MINFLKKLLEDRTYPLMRQPDRLPRCYDMTEHERLNKVREWNNRNVWNDPESSKDDRSNVNFGA